MVLRSPELPFAKIFKTQIRSIGEGYRQAKPSSKKASTSRLMEPKKGVSLLGIGPRMTANYCYSHLHGAHVLRQSQIADLGGAQSTAHERPLGQYALQLPAGVTSGTGEVSSAAVSW